MQKTQIQTARKKTNRDIKWRRIYNLKTPGGVRTVFEYLKLIFRLRFMRFCQHLQWDWVRAADLSFKSVDAGWLTTAVPDKLKRGDDDSQGQSDEQHDKDSADVSDTQRTGFTLLLLVVTHAHPGVLPPLVVQDLDTPALLHRQNRHRDPVAILRSYTHRHTECN